MCKVWEWQVASKDSHSGWCSWSIAFSAPCYTFQSLLKWVPQKGRSRGASPAKQGCYDVEALTFSNEPRGKER